MKAEWKFNGEPIGKPLCVYDGSQESIDNCVAVMCKDLGVEFNIDEYPAGMIMVALWARILQLQQSTEGLVFKGREGYTLPWANGEKT